MSERQPIRLTVAEDRAIRLAEAIPYSAGGIWAELGEVLLIQEVLAGQAIKDNPGKDTTRAFALAQAKIEIFNYLTPAVHENPDGEGLKLAVAHIYTKELTAITLGENVKGAIEILHSIGS